MGKAPLLIAICDGARGLAIDGVNFLLQQGYPQEIALQVADPATRYVVGAKPELYRP
jgi:hypothetical protein